VTIDQDVEQRRLVGELLPALRSEGLIDAVLAVEALLAAMAHHGIQRWRGLSWLEILRHLRDHVCEVAEEPGRIDADSKHRTAAHVAARALMVLQRVIEAGR
jgi:hypothetical protein